jgi:putative phage-type endonuclease
MNEIVQRSEAWFQIRLGKVTASRVADVIARTKTGFGASRQNYMAELIVERLTGVPQESYINGPIQWGIDHEDEALVAYEFWRNVTTTKIGFVPHPTIAMSGASPDSLIDDDGLVEVKAPNSATHLDTLLGKSIPDKYVVQVQYQMACTGRQWCDWVSFDPRMPEHLQLFVQRVHRDDVRIGELERQVEAFLDELDAKLARLRELYVEPLLMAG